MRWWVAVACLAGALGCDGLARNEPPAAAPTRTVSGPDGGAVTATAGNDAAAPATGRDAGAPPLSHDAGARGDAGGPGRADGGGAAGGAGAGISCPVTTGAQPTADAGAPSAVVPEAPAELAPCATQPAFSPALRLAPVDPGQRYIRCGTYGPERSWQVTLSPAGRYLAAQTSEGTVRLIDVQQWREIVQLASPVGRLDAVAFTPDGLHLATLSAEAGEVTLWRTSDGNLERSWALTPASTIDATSSSVPECRPRFDIGREQRAAPGAKGQDRRHCPRDESTATANVRLARAGSRGRARERGETARRCQADLSTQSQLPAS